MDLDGSITQLSGIGEKTKKTLSKIGVETPRDLLFYMPRGYKDFSEVRALGNLKIGESAFLCVKILSAPMTRRIRKNLEITTFQVSDETAVVTVTLFNQTYLKTRLRMGDNLYLYGKLTFQAGSTRLTSPELYFKKPQDDFLPIYPLTAGLTQHMLRKYVKEALARCSIGELYSEGFIRKFSIMEIGVALANLHFPTDLMHAAAARDRIVLDELLIFCRMIGLLNEEKSPSSEIKIPAIRDNWIRFVKKLGFAPTRAQKKVMQEIARDLEGERYMNRLLQGDVGSGKTAVAFFAVDCLYQSGYQSVIMAPTEILAEQHYRTACKLFPDESVVLVIGSLNTTGRREAQARIENGDAKVIIGTHALLYGDVLFHRLGLLITDEQHRFGVKQRAALSGGGDIHSLIMSATPIPRSLALVLYGKTDISIINELPPGRKLVKTYLIRAHKYQDMIDFIKGELKNGRQAYIVCPLIEDSGEVDAKSAQQMFEEIRKCYPDIAAQLLHGKLRNAQKQEIMKCFSEGQTKILISTTVIEVGINVPNATVMVVMGAERFGLAQLHQLRGRVGRGSEQSYCFLVSDSENAQERLRVMTATNDGFLIAEKDMEFRGVGDIFGTRQHGQGILRVASLIRDARQLEKARRILELLKDEPEMIFEYNNITRAAEAKMCSKMLEIAWN
jgi:ATP-dependent DNA helicase RecG